MSSLSFEVLPATVQDAVKLATVVYLANQQIPQYAEMLHMPPVTQEEQVEFYAGSFRNAIAMEGMEEGRALGMNILKAVLTDGEGKETVAGFACWFIPPSGIKVGEIGGEESAGEGEEQKKEGSDTNLLKWPTGINAARFMRDSSLEAQQFKEKFLSKYGAEIETLAVHPKYQRKGVGALLVNWGLEKADAAGMRSFVHSTENARELYERHGFRKVATLATDLSKYGGTGMMTTICMLREVHAVDVGPLFS